jgi:hypothetical protein
MAMASITSVNLLDYAYRTEKNSDVKGRISACKICKNGSITAEKDSIDLDDAHTNG